MNDTAAAPKARFLDRTTPPHISTLILVTAVGAMNLNLVLPSLTAIANDLDIEYALAQLLVSAYLGMTALIQLVIGPFSDRFGRRPVLIASFLIFIAASLIAAFAVNFTILLGARLIQSTIVAGLALSRAAARDMVPMDKAASLIGYITMGMAVVPMFAPAIGGLVEEYFGWRYNFALSAIVGFIVLIILFLDFRETNLHPSDSFSTQFRAYPELLTSRRFWGFSLTAMFASGTFFALLGGAPFVAEFHLNLSPSIMGFYFIFISLGYMIGNFISGRYSQIIGVYKMIIRGCFIAASGPLLALLLFLLGYASAASFFAPLFLVGLGNGMTLPSANAGVVSVRPHLAGSASGLSGALTVGGGAALSVFAGLTLTRASGPYPLFYLMSASLIMAILAAYYTQWVENRLETSTK